MEAYPRLAQRCRTELDVLSRSDTPISLREPDGLMSGKNSSRESSLARPRDFEIAATEGLRDFEIVATDEIATTPQGGLRLASTPAQGILAHWFILREIGVTRRREDKGLTQVRGAHHGRTCRKARHPAG